ncbi:MAG: ferredoxin [Brachyspira sp.]|jgi:hypothetical protein|nr:ferredoxin [Brachyspira sp.]CCY25369.1 unknown [Brachyspira sp. CAG:484]
MFVSVSNRCKGCGACAKISPEVFDIFGKYAIANQNKVCGNEAACIDAALNCPADAIVIDDWK